MSKIVTFNQFVNHLGVSVNNLVNLRHKFEQLYNNQAEDKFLTDVLTDLVFKIDFAIKSLNDCKGLVNDIIVDDRLLEILNDIKGCSDDLILHLNDKQDLDFLKQRLERDFQDFIKMLVNRIFNSSRQLFNDVANNNLVFNLQSKLSEATKQLEEIRGQSNQVKSAIALIDGQGTEDIYSAATTEFTKYAKFYEKCFYYFIALISSIFLFTLCHFPYGRLELADYIFLKVFVISIALTLATLFLRRSAHNRKLATQAHQTSLELQALPLFTRSLSDEQKQQIYFELASKYFGKEVDQTQHDKIGDLLQDQMKLSTELLRASTDMVKTVKTETTPKAETPPKAEQ